MPRIHIPRGASHEYLTAMLERLKKPNQYRTYDQTYANWEARETVSNLLKKLTAAPKPKIPVEPLREPPKKDWFKGLL